MTTGGGYWANEALGFPHAPCTCPGGAVQRIGNATGNAEKGCGNSGPPQVLFTAK